MNVRFLQVEDPRFVGWASSRAAWLEKLFFGHAKESGFLAKVLEPSPGTFVHMRRDPTGTWKIRIVGGPADLRAWHQSGPTQSIEADSTGKVLLTQPYYPANWSPDFSTFARDTGAGIGLLYKGTGQTEYVVPGSTALPEFPNTSFFQNSVCSLASNGKTAVTAVAAPSATSVAKVAQFDSVAGWSSRDVPMPPVDLTGVNVAGATLAASAALDSPATYWSTTRSVADNNPYNGASRTITANFAWGVLADPFDKSKVFVDVRADVASVTRTFVVPGITLRFWRLDILQQLWAYDIASGTWTLWWQHSDQGTDAAAVTSISEHGDASNGFSYGAGFAQSARDLSHYEVAFDPDVTRVVSWDNRALPQPTHVDHTFDANGLEPQVVRDSATRNTAADVKLDGTLWSSAVATDAAAGAAGVAVRALGTLRRGVLDSTTSSSGKKGIVWMHSAGETVLAHASVFASKTAEWLFYGVGQTTVYKTGVLVQAVNYTNAVVLKTSWKTDGDFLLYYEGSGAAYVGQGGTVVVGGTPAAVPPNPAAPTDAFSLDGTKLYLPPFGELTPAQVSALFSGASVVFQPNGTPVTVPPQGSTPNLVTASTNGILVTKRVWPLTIATVAYDKAQVVPDDFVVR